MHIGRILQYILYSKLIVLFIVYYLRNIMYRNRKHKPYHNRNIIKVKLKPDLKPK